MFSKIPWLSIGRFTLVVLCLLLVLVLAVMVLPVYLDITAFKKPIEQALSEIVGAPLSVEEVRLHPSPWPTLRIAGVQVTGSGGADSPAFSHIDRAEFQLSLFSLMRRQLRLQKLLLSGSTFHAQRREGQSGNWPLQRELNLQIKELSGIELENVTLILEDHHTVMATMGIDRLTCEIKQSTPLKLDLAGSFEDMPLSVSASGPTLSSLFQATDFPLAVDLGLADLTLGLNGSVSREPSGSKLDFSFDLNGQGLSVLRKITQADLPEVGGFDLTGQLSSRDATWEVTDLEGFLGVTSLYGHLTLDQGAVERSHLGGRLSLGTVDLDPWLSQPGSQDPDDKRPLDLSWLSSLDADLKVTTQKLSGLDPEIDNLSLDIGLENGRLSVPTTLQVAEIPLSADLTLTTDQETPALEIQLAARELTMNQLSSIGSVPERLDGRFGALDLHLTSSGGSVDEFHANLLVEVTAKQSLFVLEGEDESLEIQLREAHAAYRPGSPMRFEAEGVLLDESFVFELQTAALASLLGSDRWPLRASLRGAGARFEVDGVLEEMSSDMDFDFDFELTGERLGDLSNWVAIPSQVDLAYSLRGRWTSAAGARHLSLEDSSIGRSRFTGKVARQIEDPTRPILIELHAYSLDLRELRDVSGSATVLDSKSQRLGVDMPILPSKFSFVDAEIDLTVDRLLRPTVDLTDVSTSFLFREGRLDPSPFSFTYDTQEFSGEINLDLRAEVPHFSLEIQGEGDRLGEILEQEDLAESFTIAASNLDFRIDASGASLRRILQTAAVSGRLDDVRWQIEPPEFEEPILMLFDRVDLRGPKGEPITLTASGHIDKVPLDIQLVLRTPEDPVEKLDQTIPFEASLALAATEVELRGEAELPLTRRWFDFQMLVEGESLATLSILADADLPDIGPYRIVSHAILREEGYRFEGIEAKVGESDLLGELQYLRINDRPTFSADLTSQLLRTEDFVDLEPRTESEQQGAEPPSQTPKADKAPSLTLERFNGFDATINLEAHQIVTLGGQVDNMEVALDLDHGSLDFTLRRDQETSKQAELTAQVRPLNQGIEANVRAAWDRQPYGVIADLMNPNAAGGAWGIDLDLSSKGATLSDLTANLYGHLYFADYPIGFDATLLDILGGGLLDSLLPVFQIGDESQVNCTVAKFQVNQGVLTPESLIVDTTRSRISGKGTIDLPGNRIDLHLKPRPKKRNLINLSTPVKIRGPLNDPNVQVSKGGLAVTFFRLSLWVYTVWRDLARKPLPADGSDVCVDPFSAPAH